MSKQTQQEKILQLLKQYPAGLNSFGVAREIALQLPTRISELKIKGYQIVSIRKPDTSVDYVLQGEPEIERKPIRYEFQDNRAIPVYE